jgi:hypothetical protein
MAYSVQTDVLIMDFSKAFDSQSQSSHTQTKLLRDTW